MMEGLVCVRTQDTSSLVFHMQICTYNAKAKFSPKVAEFAEVVRALKRNSVRTENKNKRDAWRKIALREADE